MIVHHAMTRLKAQRIAALLGFAVLFHSAARGPSQVLHIQVQINRLNGDPVPRLHGQDFFVFGGSGRLAVSAVQPSLSHERASPLPAMRVLMIFPSIAGFSDRADISKVLASSLTIPFGKAEIAVMRADGTTTRYASSKADLIASVESPRFETRGMESFQHLGEYAGRRAVVFFVGAYQNVPTDVIDVAKSICALVYEVGANAEAPTTFTNEPSPAGLPFSGGRLVFDASVRPHVGFAVVSEGYASSEPYLLNGVRYAHSLDAALKKMVKDGRGFYDLSTAAAGAGPTLRLGLARGEEYVMEAQAYSAGAAETPELTLGPPAKHQP